MTFLIKVISGPVSIDQNSELWFGADVRLLILLMQSLDEVKTFQVDLGRNNVALSVSSPLPGMVSCCHRCTRSSSQQLQGSAEYSSFWGCWSRQ